MGTDIQPSALEGDSICVAEMNLLCYKMSKWTHELHQKSCKDALWKQEKSTILHSKLCSVLIEAKRPCNERKLLLQTNMKSHLLFAAAHVDKDIEFWRRVLWLDETKIELFDHSYHCYILEKKAKRSDIRTPHQL